MTFIPVLGWLPTGLLWIVLCLTVFVVLCWLVEKLRPKSSGRRVTPTVARRRP
jgi:hypothetical protein